MRGPRRGRTSRSRTLRRQSTSAEDRLWSGLRNRNLGGYKFVRQAPLGPFVVDFLCREHRLVVEVDGATHSEPHEIAADCARTRYLESLGYRVFRAWNGDVYENIDGVLEKLLALLEGRLRWREI